MGGRLRREGIYVYLWLTLTVWQKLSQSCKAIIHQLKLAVKKLYDIHIYVTSNSYTVMSSFI